jgi:inorganic triphosphatase YgiF
MVETELKFQVPAGARAAVERRFATRTAQTLELRAKYFDTPDRRLARAGLALRLRKEGTHWVQALKGRGPSALQRLEHEVAVDATGGEPAIDIARHAGTAPGALLAGALAGGAAPVQMVFETRVQRTHRLVRSQGMVVEIALDVGAIVAGVKRAPIWELEFELKRGSVDALLALAARWVRRHGLWLDVRSKAERGVRLAQGVDAGPPVSASDVALAPGSSPDAALRAIVAACLAQVLPNAAEVAGGAGGAEHLHQLRVGLRRLRCALRVFGDFSAATDPAWSPALAALFVRLGSARNRDALAESVLPALRLAGAPLADLPLSAAPASDDPGEALRSAACNTLLLALIGFSQAAVPAPAGRADAASPSLPSLVRPRLRHMRHQLKADAHAFDTLDEALRHRARKRLKRLRYSVEFFASLFSAKGLKQWLARARPAQDVLGRLNDLAVAIEAFQALLAQDGRAAFAVDWLSARRAEAVAPAGDALAGLVSAPLTLRKEGRASARSPRKPR